MENNKTYEELSKKTFWQDAKEDLIDFGKEFVKTILLLAFVIIPLTIALSKVHSEPQKGSSTAEQVILHTYKVNRR